MKKNWNTDTWPQKSWDQETCVHSEGAVPIQQSEPTVLSLCTIQWGKDYLALLGGLCS